VKEESKSFVNQTQNSMYLNALLKASEVLKELHESDLLPEGSDIKSEAVSAIILLGEAIEDIELHDAWHNAPKEDTE